ncbi:MAG: 16S rRNA (cytosine(967)-C(5))-methyltransferase RsmB [Oscillospiraceae bacterium]|jgi:16S rRNA (cytosine967-C5)-methyltransferase|nr:16S rRNA (cytosine(967)-C(5))-methyltransferase RsmB [Oscillospiraceae bacterium]
MSINEREIAFNALLRVERDGAYSNLVLSSLLKEVEDERGRAFISALVYGVLENEQLLDYAIDRYSKQRADRLEREVRLILRMGFYQLLFMSGVPESAAVNESVKLSKSIELERAAGYINGVLRAFIRAEKKLPLPDKRMYPLLHLSAKHSCPMWILKLWRDSYGLELCRLSAEALAGKPPLFVRVNTTKITAEELAARLGESGITAKPTNIPDSLKLDLSGAAEQLPEYHEGLFHVQDISSQLCCILLGVSKGDRVLDVCAAPGGKSFTLAEMMSNSGELVSCDLHAHRVRLIEAGAGRLELSSIRPMARDALARDADKVGEFDRILCDVPCSGLGVIRRKPDIKSKPESDIKSLVPLQAAILKSSARLLKSGGVLIYSTCTLNPAENIKIVDKFLRSNTDFEPYDIEDTYRFERRTDEPRHTLTLFPQKGGSDGFFIARMRKKGRLK